MLDKRFKEKILDGTMCAFVSKELSSNLPQVGEEFYFAHEVKDFKAGGNNYHDRIVTVPTRFNKELPYYYKFIAKAECIGIFLFDGLFLINTIFINEQYFSVSLHTPQQLGFENYKDCKDYYKPLLGETMKGSLHIFKLVEGK